MKQALTGINDLLYGTFIPETLKYWVGVQQGQSYLMGRKVSLALVGHLGSFRSRLQELKSWYTFFHAPNDMFFIHDCAPHILCTLNSHSCMHGR